jgi:hypothetical protein
MNPSERIDQLIAGLTDWRGKTLAIIRKSILQADREIIEEWKWMGSPVWSRDGIIAVGNAHKDKVKLTFSHGASLPDPDKLFNAGLGGNAWRAIDVFDGDKVNERALKNRVRAAVEYNEKIEEESARGYSSEGTQKQKVMKLRVLLADFLCGTTADQHRSPLHLNRCNPGGMCFDALDCLLGGIRLLRPASSGPGSC